MGISITLTVPRQRIASVLCSALEGGITYWCDEVKIVQPKKWKHFAYPKNDNERWAHDAPVNPGGAILIYDAEDEKWHRLGIRAIEKGLKLMAEKHPRDFAAFFDDSLEDAAIGDTFVQLCIFGKLVYG